MTKANDLPTPSRRLQLIEVCVFLFLITPSFALSFYSGTRSELVKFDILAIFTILRDLGLLSLILFFLWRNGENLESIGWRSKDIWKNIGLGVLLFIPLFIGVGFIERALEALGFSSPKVPLKDYFRINTDSDFLLGVILVIVVAIVEETIFRGYLIRRLNAVCKSLPAAAFISSVIFSLGHGYEGNVGVITVGITGLMLAIVYVWRKSIIAPVIMHFLFDFVGILLISHT